MDVLCHIALSAAARGSSSGDDDDVAAPRARAEPSSTTRTAGTEGADGADAGPRPPRARGSRRGRAGTRAAEADEARRSSPEEEEPIPSPAALREYTGVQQQKSGRYRVRIKRDGRYHGLGVYNTAVDAARAYDEAARKAGRTSDLNFPDPEAPNERARQKRPPKRFRGVRYVESRGKWRAEVTYCGRSRYVGYFQTEEEAARAWDEAALEVGRTDLNFPLECPTAGGGFPAAAGAGPSLRFPPPKRARSARKRPAATTRAEDGEELEGLEEEEEGLEEEAEATAAAPAPPSRRGSGATPAETDKERGSSTEKDPPSVDASDVKPKR